MCLIILFDVCVAYVMDTLLSKWYRQLVFNSFYTGGDHSNQVKLQTTELSIHCPFTPSKGGRTSKKKDRQTSNNMFAFPSAFARRWELALGYQRAAMSSRFFWHCSPESYKRYHWFLLNIHCNCCKMFQSVLEWIYFRVKN